MFDHMINGAYDLGKLYRAWERHYEDLGLGTLRARECANKKTQMHKAPPGYTFEQLAKWNPSAYRG